MRKIAVLFIDEAVKFGGSLVVIGKLIDGLDKTRFRSILVGELDRASLERLVNGQARTYRIARLYNYAHWGRTVAVINRLPGCALRRLSNYLLSAVRSIANSVYLVRVAAVVVREKVDVIHVNNGMNNLAPVLCALVLGRKFVVHVHGIETPGFIQRRLLNRVPHFITVSEYLRDRLINNGYPALRLSVLPNPVNQEDISPSQVEAVRKRCGIGRDDRVLGIVGRIVRWKGHVEFLKAAVIAMRAVPGLKVLIVGEFSGESPAYRKQIAQIIEDSGYRDSIILTGFVSDVQNYYGLMDVCVHASIEPEPFGLVITEAMACGVPVVASDLGAPREIIADGENGYLVNPTDTQRLADIIIQLLKDEALRKDIGGRGKAHVQEEYGVDRFAHAMGRVYTDLLGDRAS